MRGASPRVAPSVLVLSLALSGAVPSGAGEALQFVLPDIDGREFSLKKEVGAGPLVLDFWATWCKPCIKELPVLQEISTDYEKRGVRVVTINIDGPHNQAKIRPFMHRHRLQLPVLLDKTGSVIKQFQLISVPSTVIISSAGEVVYKHSGYKPGDEKVLRSKLDELLDHGAPINTNQEVEAGS